MDETQIWITVVGRAKTGKSTVAEIIAEELRIRGATVDVEDDEPSRSPNLPESLTVKIIVGSPQKIT